MITTRLLNGVMMSPKGLVRSGSELPKQVGFDPASYNLEVIDVRPYADPLTTEQGTFWFDEWSVADHKNEIVTRYREVTGISANQTTDLGVAIGTPWLTAEDGHNFRTLRTYMSAGISGRIIGPPRIWQKGASLLSSVQGTVEAASHVELGSDAVAYMLILSVQDEQGKFRFSLRPDEIMYHGESRGAMIGFGIQSVAKHMKRTIHASELIDPCFANATEIWNLAQPNNLPKIIGELSTVGKIFGNFLLEKRRKHYHKTFDPSLEYVIPAYTTLSALSNGQAGIMAGLMPFATVANITHYTSSVANDQDEYKRILQDFAGVEFYYEDGGHLALARRQAIYKPVGRLMIVQNQVEERGYVYQPDSMKESTPFAA